MMSSLSSSLYVSGGDSSRGGDGGRGFDDMTDVALLGGIKGDERLGKISPPPFNDLASISNYNSGTYK